MKDIDFTSCAFIREELRFLTYSDFCRNAKILKLFYNALDTNAKLFYKWFVYSNIHMNENFKNKIWEYLNSEDPTYYISLMEGLSKYKVK